MGFINNTNYPFGFKPRNPIDNTLLWGSEIISYPPGHFESAFLYPLELGGLASYIQGTGTVSGTISYIYHRYMTSGISGIGSITADIYAPQILIEATLGGTGSIDADLSYVTHNDMLATIVGWGRVRAFLSTPEIPFSVSGMTLADGVYRKTKQSLLLYDTESESRTIYVKDNVFEATLDASGVPNGDILLIGNDTLIVSSITLEPEKQRVKITCTSATTEEHYRNEVIYVDETLYFIENNMLSQQRSRKPFHPFYDYYITVQDYAFNDVERQFYIKKGQTSSECASADYEAVDTPYKLLSAPVDSVIGVNFTGNWKKSYASSGITVSYTAWDYPSNCYPDGCITVTTTTPNGGVERIYPRGIDVDSEISLWMKTISGGGDATIYLDRTIPLSSVTYGSSSMEASASFSLPTSGLDWQLVTISLSGVSDTVLENAHWVRFEFPSSTEARFDTIYREKYYSFFQYYLTVTGVKRAQDYTLVDEGIKLRASTNFFRWYEFL